MQSSPSSDKTSAFPTQKPTAWFDGGGGGAGATKRKQQEQLAQQARKACENLIAKVSSVEEQTSPRGKQPEKEIWYRNDSEWRVVGKCGEFREFPKGKSRKRPVLKKKLNPKIGPSWRSASSDAGSRNAVRRKLAAAAARARWLRKGADVSTAQ